jgi:hypothetical protein
MPAESDSRVQVTTPPRGTRSSLAGIGALVAGVAWITWAAVNTRTHGGLDAGASVVGEPMARAGALLMVAWNVLLLPAALALHAELSPRAPERMRVATLAGIVSLLFWAFGGATHSITPALEVSYIALSAVWWGGVGATILPARRAFGVFTIVLALFAGWDALLTAWEPVPFGLYMTAAPKLPLSIVWDFWLALVLLRPSRD